MFGIGTGSEPEPNRNRFIGSEPDPPNRFGTGKPETQEPVNRNRKIYPVYRFLNRKQFRFLNRKSFRPGGSPRHGFGSLSGHAHAPPNTNEPRATRDTPRPPATTKETRRRTARRRTPAPPTPKPWRSKPPKPVQKPEKPNPNRNTFTGSETVRVIPVPGPEPVLHEPVNR